MGRAAGREPVPGIALCAQTSCPVLCDESPGKTCSCHTDQEGLGMALDNFLETESEWILNPLIVLQKFPKCHPICSEKGSFTSEGLSVVSKQVKRAADFRNAGVRFGWEETSLKQSEPPALASPGIRYDSCSLGVCPYPGSQPNQGAGLAPESCQR